jgi:energy-coupling factor transporter ATP-binding protein EcfA2
MITLRDVSVIFSDLASTPKNALDKFTIDIQAGEWITLIGPNGSGKTTLLHAVAGLVKPSAGRIEYASGARPRTALLFQDPDNQFVTTTVGSELILSPPAGQTAEEISRRVASAADRFDLAHLKERNPHRLSGGEKQRLALATVWLQDPEVLLLDEPSAYLDPEGAEMCLDFVAEMHGGGATVLWVTPGGDEITRAERVVCLDSGRIVFSGQVEELFVWSRVSDFDFVKPPLWDLSERVDGVVGGALFADNTSADFVSSPVTLATRIANVAGPSGSGDIENRPDEPSSAREADPVVVLGCVDFGYDGNPVLKSVDFRLVTGECVGLAGHNGAGKSTLLGLLAGVHKPDGGLLEQKFKSITDGRRQNIFYLFQSPEQLFFAESVAEEIGFGLKRLGLEAGERKRRSFEALERVGLDPDVYLPREPLTLSPGEMRRVAFAIAVALQPALLLLDEPSSCLDPAGRRILDSVIINRRENRDTTVVASHDASFLAEVCDRVVWLRDGKVETVLDTSRDILPPGQTWPGRLPAVLELQNHLADHGLDLTPRTLTTTGLIARLKNRDS